MKIGVIVVSITNAIQTKKVNQDEKSKLNKK